METMIAGQKSVEVQRQRHARGAVAQGDVAD